MKQVLSIICMLIASYSVHAAEVVGARVNQSEGVIEVDVKYGGGCAQHEFQLQGSLCLETYPVQCTFAVLHNSNGDFCEALIMETVKFSIKEYGLTDPYFEGALLTIVGDGKSQAMVQLPWSSVKEPWQNMSGH